MIEVLLCDLIDPATVLLWDKQAFHRQYSHIERMQSKDGVKPAVHTYKGAFFCIECCNYLDKKGRIFTFAV